MFAEIVTGLLPREFLLLWQIGTFNRRHELADERLGSGKLKLILSYAYTGRRLKGRHQIQEDAR